MLFKILLTRNHHPERMTPSHQFQYASVRFRYAQIVSVHPHPCGEFSDGTAQTVTPGKWRGIADIVIFQENRFPFRNIRIPTGPPTDAEVLQKFIDGIKDATCTVTGQNQIVSCFLQNNFIRLQTGKINSQKPGVFRRLPQTDGVAFEFRSPDNGKKCAADFLQIILELLCGCFFHSSRFLR